MTKLSGLLITIFLISQPSGAAIPNSSKKQAPPTILKDLHRPLQRAVKEIYQQGPQGYKELYKVSFSSAYPMKIRWKAFMVMSRIGGEKSLPEVEKALESKEWFMRSAGLLALEKIDQEQAIVKAKDFFANDKALMVRAQAIEVLRNDPSPGTRRLMWKKLYAKENFHRSQGLWIRKKIVGYLADYGTKRDLRKFKKLFKDEDQELIQLAFPAFERILNKKPSDALTSAGQVAFWQNQFRRF